MKTRQVIDLAREWVAMNAIPMPGFLGAHLMGSINFMTKESLFPHYKDVDLHLVLENPPEGDPQDFAYRGLILEVAAVGADHYDSHERILSDPGLAANLAASSILADPNGMLSKLHATVSQEYARNRWVSQRCEAEKTVALQGLAGLQHANSPVEALGPLLGSLAVGLAGLVAVANLRPPTHRRCLILMRELLTSIDRVDLQEDLLDLLGYAHLSRLQVECRLHDVAEAFDRAVQIIRSPVPLGFKLQPHVRPYLVDASQEMIAEGFHREAMGWIMVFLMITMNVLQTEAPEDEKTYFQTKANYILGEVGWDTLNDKPRRMQQAQRLVNEIFRVADEIVHHNPEVLP